LRLNWQSNTALLEADGLAEPPMVALARTNTQACLINTPWVGKLTQAYFCVFKKTVEANDLKFHFTYFGDSSLPDCPAAAPDSKGEVIFHHLEVNSTIQRSMDRLGLTREEAKTLVDNTLTCPYANNDLKPILGLWFEDYFDGCKFWGWGDHDLVFGDLSALELDTTPYDMLSAYHPTVAGPLFFARNIPETKRLFLKSSDWKRFVLTKGLTVFDEGWKGGESFNKMYMQETSLKKHPDFTVFGKCHSDHFEGRCGGHKSRDSRRTMTWNKNKIELKMGNGKTDHPVFFHFRIWKENKLPVPSEILDANVSCFRMSEDGFSTCDDKEFDAKILTKSKDIVMNDLQRSEHTHKCFVTD